MRFAGCFVVLGTVGRMFCVVFGWFNAIFAGVSCVFPFFPLVFCEIWWVLRSVSVGFRGFSWIIVGISWFLVVFYGFWYYSVGVFWCFFVVFFGSFVFIFGVSCF